MTLAKLIEALATTQANADASRTGGRLNYVPPTHTEILDTVSDPATGQTTAWFIFDFVIYHMTLSGSDWYYHHVFGGSATIANDKIIDSKLVRLREEHITEHEMEWAPAAERYDRDHMRNFNRDEWWPNARAEHGRTK